jgi:hypothetical protein
MDFILSPFPELHSEDFEEMNELKKELSNSFSPAEISIIYDILSEKEEREGFTDEQSALYQKVFELMKSENKKEK